MWWRGRGDYGGEKWADDGTEGGGQVIVRVRLFASLRRRYPHLGIGEPISVELPEGATLDQLVEHLQLPVNEVKVIFVNGIVRGKDHPLADGDEVGIFPPVGGG